jgi:phospholipid/cholesterol/gamma-HCH transport system substrate-binding protein
MKRRDEVSVGILLTVAVIVLVTGTLWLVRGGLSRGYPLHVRFAWGHSVKQGQAVVLAGVTVGYVNDVQLNADGYLDVDLTVRKQYKIPKTVIAEVYPVGIFGDVIVALKTGAPTRDAFAAGDTLPSKPASSSGLDALQAKADTIATSLLKVIQVLESEMVAAGTLRHVRETVAGMTRLTAQLQTAVTEQNKNMTSTMTSIRNAVDAAEIAKTLQQMRITAANGDSLMSRLSTNTTQLQAILARLERGEGTAGKLLTDTLLYRDLRALAARADLLLTDFQKNPKKYINLRIF